MRKISKMNIVEISTIDIILSLFTQAYGYIFQNNIFEETGFTKYTVKELILNCISYRLIILVILYAIFLWIIFMYKKEVGSFIYKYRYLLAIIIFILCVVFEVSGSSIGVWSNYLPNSKGISDGVLFGKSRLIRSDEWAVNTPMAFSQYYNNFSYFSNIIRGISTDVFIIYGQAVKDIAVVFRPFYIGYLFLSPAKGLAFFWCGRLIALFIVTFEFGMLVTNKNKIHSVVTAFLISFAPVVQWWFAVNGLVEMLIFSQLAVLMLYEYMRTDNYLKRIVFAIVSAICAGGYVLTFYPPWQVPIFYVLIAFVIWVLITNWKGFKFSAKKDIPIISVVSIILLLIMYHILHNSMDTIKTVMNTVYPGKRVDLGGGGFGGLWKYISNTFLVITGNSLPLNQCENAVFFDLFPMGLIFSVYIIIKEKKRDVLLISLLIVDVILTLFVVFPLPELIAKISFLSHSTTARANIGIGLINIFLLIRSLAISKESYNKVFACVVTFCLSIIVNHFAVKFMGDYMNNSMKLVSFIILFTLFYMIIMHKKYNEMLAITICMLMLFMGGLVNPIRIGTGVIFESDLSKKIESIAKNDDGLWIVEDLGFPMINYPMMLGAPTINCTNTYPVMERWRSLDSEGKYDDVYNRYAHIQVKLSNEITQFTLNTPDTFKINLNINDLSKLKVKYILSANDLESLANHDVGIKKLTEVDNYKIYEVTY